MELVLDTFEPASHSTIAYRFSVAHPPSWEDLTGDVAQYWAENLQAQQRLEVQARSRTGYNTLLTYVDQVRILTGETSRQSVYTGRPDPSYRIEYSSLSLFLDVGTKVKGVALITFALADAIWVHVEGLPEDWENTKALADDILARAVVLN